MRGRGRSECELPTRLADRRRLRRGGGDRGQGRQRARARLPARAAARSIVASDGSADATAERARAAGADLVLDLPPRRQGRRPERRPPSGRSGEILAFSDANSIWAPDALRAPGRAASPTPPSATSAARSASSTPAATTSRAPTGATRWRCGRWSRRWPGSPPATARIYAVRRDAYIPLAPSGSHDLSLPLRAAPSAACARSTCPAARAEEKMVPTLEGEFARKRRMMVGLWDIVVGEGMLSPARLPAALRLRDRLAPAAALPQPAPAPGRPRRQRSPCSATAGSTSSPSPLQLALLAAALLGRCLPLGPAADRPLLRDDHRLDRRRPLGPLPPRAPRPLGEGGGDPVMPRALDILIAALALRRPLAAAAGRRDRDQARAAAARSSTASAGSASAAASSSC